MATVCVAKVNVAVVELGAVSVAIEVAVPVENVLLVDEYKVSVPGKYVAMFCEAVKVNEVRVAAVPVALTEKPNNEMFVWVVVSGLVASPLLPAVA